MDTRGHAGGHKDSNARHAARASIEKQRQRKPRGEDFKNQAPRNDSANTAWACGTYSQEKLVEEIDRRILAFLGRSPGTPVGLKTIAAAIGESEDTIEEVFEPHLVRMGFLHRTARGRQITRDGCRAVGLDPEPADGSLFER